MSPFTWIITGASSGLGRSVVERALAAGDAVVATSRRPLDLVAERLEVVEHDVRNLDAAPAVVETALSRFGRVDALVNNAGRGIVGAAEEISGAVLRESLDLHLHGPAALVRAALPTMRAQGSGTIVQMSSQGGRLSFPGVGAYSAGKFALEGWSEALAGEVAPFGVRVMIVEPSRFRTAFNRELVVSPVDPAYGPVLEAVRADLTGSDGLQEGDPDRAAELVVRLVHSPEVPLRLPLGGEAVRRMGGAYRTALVELERWTEFAVDADFPEAVASPHVRG